jgi:hypothetical protein
MSYPPGHRAATRAKIVESARRLFNRHGFDGVSVKQIMSGAGLTHGAFYSYFKGKSDLYTEVLGCFFTDPNWKNRWEGVEVDPDGRQAKRTLGEECLRGGFSGDGACARGQCGCESGLSARTRAGYCGFVYRWRCRRACDARRGGC